MTGSKFITVCLVVAILGVVVGMLLHPVLFKSTITIPQVTPDSTFMSGVPDTFWIESETIFVPKYIYQDTGSTEVLMIIDTVYIQEEREVIVSHKFFPHGDFVLSNVWVKSPTHIYSVDNSIVVDWQRQFDSVRRPSIERDLVRAKKSNLLKGIAAGAITTAGLLSKNPYIAAGGFVLGTTIIFVF